MRTTLGKLVKTELKLMMRDPFVLTFVFAFPIVTMLIIGGAFGTRPNPGFDHTNPAHWYVASYLTVVIAATGLVMLPVHLASSGGYALEDEAGRAGPQDPGERLVVVEGGQSQHRRPHVAAAQLAGGR